MLIGLKPDCTLSDLVRDIKANSSRWINEQKYIAGKFEWQSGFGAFTVRDSQVETVINYILNQEEHHKTKNFRQEYIDFLNTYQIPFNNKYLPEDYGAAPSELEGDDD